jgi:cytochrome c-type biogenesis protein
MFIGMSELSNIGILSAFIAGIVSFLSPCVLPLVPGYISYIAGRSALASSPEQFVVARFTTLGLSLCFVLGFTTVFVIFGASATVLGRLLLSYRFEMNIVGGGVIILFGLFMLGTIQPMWMMREARFHLDIPGGRAISAYVLGLAFAFGWTPCIGPILGAILTVSAASATVANGIVLLTVYSLGLGVPFLLAALFTDTLTARLKAIGRVGYILRTLAGVVMIAMGVAMMTGYLSTFAYWLLERFPVLSSIG